MKDVMIPQEYPFEASAFYGFKEYDAYFSRLYGPDYMTPKRWSRIEDYSNAKNQYLRSQYP